MLIKILRTVVGLPFVLMLWPFTAFASVPLILNDVLFEGGLYGENRFTCFLLLTLPYHFLKDVWED